VCRKLNKKGACTRSECCVRKASRASKSAGPSCLDTKQCAAGESIRPDAASHVCKRLNRRGMCSAPECCVKKASRLVPN
jgi:hypothetical protein